ncbi:hypothetical protein [Sorangium sp. So ce381]|uniref:hypothetical protein n=1 Tax=Sorangium sp. So ce381 TaxID=3133307 RepID=UPI003F5B90DE
MDLEKLVSVVFKAVARRNTIADSELLEILLEAGADVAVARRVVAFAPNSAARVWLRSEKITWPDHYSVHRPSSGVASLEHRPLAAEPVFAACMSVAERCSKAQRQAMFQRSATFKILRQLGQRTSPEGPGKPVNVQVGPLLMVAEYLDPPEPVAPVPRAHAQRGLFARLKRLWRGY